MNFLTKGVCRAVRTVGIGATAALALSSVLTVAPAQAQTVNVVMSGLLNPRGLAFASDGTLYVTEAGNGNGSITTGPSVNGGAGQREYFGTSGRISSLTTGGVQSVVATGFGSLAPVGGGGATGLQDIAFNTAGEAYGVIGFGANPNERVNLGANASLFGRVVRLPVGANAPANTVFGANIADFEQANNPNGDDVNTNPFSLVANADGSFTVSDAGANSLFLTSGATFTTQTVTTLTSIPARPTPPPYQSVPTGIVQGPDGNYYFGELTGGPFPVGGANIYRYNPNTGVRDIAYSGFTTVLDVAFGPGNSLYVLQGTTNGLIPPSGSGVIYRINTLTGVQTTVLSTGLSLPTGITVGSDGNLYVSNNGAAPGGGQVLRIVTAPEPASVALIGLVGLGWVAVRRRKSVA